MAGKGRHSGAWDLVARQHGVVVRRQLLRLGYGRSGIEHQLRTGRLHRVRPGIYAVGRPEISREGRWMAAVLRCGEGAFLTHRSAGALSGICSERNRVIEVGVRRRCAVAEPDLRIRWRREPGVDDLQLVAGIPTTGPSRTLVDLAALLDSRELERVVNEADKLDRIDPEALRASLDAHRGVRGVGSLRRLLDRHGFILTDSELERRFVPLALAAGLPAPETGQRLNGFAVDFLWRGMRLVVEVEGLRYHRTAASQARDILRDQAHTAAGYARLRFTYRQVTDEPDRVLRTLTATTARLAGE